MRARRRRATSSLIGRFRRPAAAARSLPDPEDGPVQPRTGSRAGRSRQGRRRLRLLRGTEDVSQCTKADFSGQEGDAHPDCWRASPRSRGELGTADTVRDPRGFALKFYTQEGNYDLVGNNTPMFFIRDPQKFSDFIHSPEAPRRHPPARQQHAVGLLDAVARVRAPGHVPDDGPGHPADLAEHERLRQPHLPVGERRRREVLGQVPLEDRAGHRELHRRRSQGDGG